MKNTPLELVHFSLKTYSKKIANYFGLFSKKAKKNIANSLQIDKNKKGLSFERPIPVGGSYRIRTCDPLLVRQML